MRTSLCRLNIGVRSSWSSTLWTKQNKWSRITCISLWKDGLRSKALIAKFSNLTTEGNLPGESSGLSKLTWEFFHTVQNFRLKLKKLVTRFHMLTAHYATGWKIMSVQLIFISSINVHHSMDVKLADWLTNKLSDWTTDRQTHWLMDWQTDWLTEWLTNSLTDRLSDWPTHWQTELTDWLTLLVWCVTWHSDHDDDRLALQHSISL